MIAVLMSAIYLTRYWREKLGGGDQRMIASVSSFHDSNMDMSPYVAFSEALLTEVGGNDHCEIAFDFTALSAETETSVLLGRGSMGNVWQRDLQYNDRIVQVAVKEYEPSSLDLEKVMLEMKTVHHLSRISGSSFHENLVGVYGICFCPPHICYLYEVCPDGSLHDLARNHPPEFSVAAQYCADVACGLLFLHEHGVMHRDVKACNVFLKGTTAKLGDFGDCHTRLEDGTGSDDEYRALTMDDLRLSEKGDFRVDFGTSSRPIPELMRVLPGEIYGYGVDVFCFGYLLFEVFTGSSPFQTVPDNCRKHGRVDCEEALMSG